MVSTHTAGTTPMTKLMVLQNAVNVITQLEQQVRGNQPYRPSNQSPARQPFHMIGLDQ